MPYTLWPLKWVGVPVATFGFKSCPRCLVLLATSLLSHSQYGAASNFPEKDLLLSVFLSFFSVPERTRENKYLVAPILKEKSYIREGNGSLNSSKKCWTLSILSLPQWITHLIPTAGSFGNIRSGVAGRRQAVICSCLLALSLAQSGCVTVLCRWKDGV